MTLGISEYFWRLLPANPILLRVVESAGKRKRDLAIRCGYLGLLVFYVVFELLTERSTGNASLTDLSNASRSIFREMSYLQLGLVALLAPIFTAGAITQEKDSQTYDILLATPLTNGQILLGSLMSRLFFVIALLISGIPIFSVTQIFGGVSIRSITLSCLIAATTACVTGALAMAIATFKVGTRRTIFSFYLFIVIYLVGLYLLDKLPFFQIQGVHVPGSQNYSHISWFTGIQPFLALRVLLGDPEYQPPPPGLVPPGWNFWPVSWYLTEPASFYITFTSVLSLVLVVPAIVLLRRVAQSSTTIQTWILQKFRIVKGDRTRKPRSVWSNPIAWREAKTKASAARASIIRWLFIVAGIAGALFLAIGSAAPESLPPKYISPGSYHPEDNTLFINGDTTYGLAKDVQIKLDTDSGEQRSLDPSALARRYGVVDFQTTVGRRSTKEITSLHLSPVRSKIAAPQVRHFLLGAIVLEFAVILLIVTNAAASTVTREKEDGTLDLLLSTPITSRYYIWGKLRGLVSYVLPLVAVPVASVVIFVIVDTFRSLNSADFDWIVLPEAALIMPPMLIIITAFASIVGMNLSLRCRTTVRAVMSSIGVVAGLCAGLVFCGQGIVSMHTNDSGMHLILSGFSPFTLLMLLVDPYTLASNVFGNANDAASARGFMIASALIATAAYAGVVWAMYTSMVKNFDMTIRRQSR